MIDLKNHFSGHMEKDSLDALYYAARFIKQARTLHLTLKDVFDDDCLSLPSLQARTLAKELIKEIEDEAGTPAAEFSEGFFVEAVRHLFSAMEELKQDFSPAEIASADQAIASMMGPESRV